MVKNQTHQNYDNRAKLQMHLIFNICIFHGYNMSVCCNMEAEAVKIIIKTSTNEEPYYFT